MTTVVLLNGAGSSGKTSIARELQQIASRPFLHVQMDSFLEMLPEPFHDHPDGFRFVEQVVHGHREVGITAGPVGERLMVGMRRSIAALASAGNDLVVDDVLLGDELNDYRSLLGDFDFRAVAVKASLDVLEQREQARGDRLIGLSRGQFDRVHHGKLHDFEVDTTTMSAAGCAALIKTRFDL